MKVEVSNGEIIDKYTILLIKEKNILDSIKNKNIKYELSLLKTLIELINIDQNHIDELFEINNKLWNIEEDIRIKEKNNEFDAIFIDLARSVYKVNTLRYVAKQKINEITNSAIKEEKSH